MIYISRTLLPSIQEYRKYLKRIWKANWLTNNGQLVQELEEKLKEYWGVKNVVCVSSGTSAITVAMKAMELEEIHMSPNSFVATASAPDFINVKPIFYDVDEEPKGTALVTHLYGMPNVIDHKPVIYDASHAFTTKYKGESVLKQGDMSVISFNAVKIFQTVEGGAVVTENDELADRARWIRNHGVDPKDRYNVLGTGVNFKMSEFHAAMGLSVLPLVDKMRKRYDEIIEMYNEALGYDYEQLTYYPVYYDSYEDVDKAIKVFEENGVFPRRYFYPPLNKVFGGKSCPIAEDIMSRVLCIPLYYALTNREVKKVINLVKETK